MRVNLVRDELQRTDQVSCEFHSADVDAYVTHNQLRESSLGEISTLVSSVTPKSFILPRGACLDLLTQEDARTNSSPNSYIKPDPKPKRGDQVPRGADKRSVNS